MAQSKGKYDFLNFIRISFERVVFLLYILTYVEIQAVFYQEKDNFKDRIEVDYYY